MNTFCSLQWALNKGTLKKLIFWQNTQQAVKKLKRTGVFVLFYIPLMLSQRLPGSSQTIHRNFMYLAIPSFPEFIAR